MAAPISGLNVGISYAYTDAAYTSFVGCAVGIDCSGNPVPFTPKNDLKVFANYTFDVAGGSVTLHGDDQWASSFQVTPTHAQPIGVSHTARKDFITKCMANGEGDAPVAKKKMKATPAATKPPM